MFGYSAKVNVYPSLLDLYKNVEITIEIDPDYMHVIPVESFTIQENLELLEGERHQIRCELLPHDATDKTVSFLSSDENIATVDEAGNVTFIRSVYFIEAKGDEKKVNDYKRMGLLIKQAREEKGWTQQELADAVDVDAETVRKQELGDDSLSVEMMMEYCLLLNISCDIAIYEKDVETALRMERICRELLELSQEQFDRLVKSASYIRSWRENQPRE